MECKKNLTASNAANKIIAKYSVERILNWERGDYAMREAIDELREIKSKLDKPFIWDITRPTQVKFLDLYPYEYFDIDIYKLLAEKSGKSNMSDVAEVVCDEDVEWGKERNKNLGGQLFYKYSLKADMVEYLAPIIDGWLKTVTQALNEYQARRRKSEVEDELRKKEFVVTVVKKGQQGSGEGLEYYAIVDMTEIETGKTLRFACRNIFDVGYIINPLYIPDGGFEADGKWYVMVDGREELRDMTELEKKCVQYLKDFPPIYNGIMM